MARILVVTHSASKRDSVLWEEMLETFPNLDLVFPLLPGSQDVQWLQAYKRSGRVFTMPAIEPVGKGHSALWIPGLRDQLTEGRYDLLHAAVEPWSLIPQAFVKRIPTVVQGAESIISTAPWPVRVRRIGLQRVLRNVAGLSAWGQTSINAFIKAGLPTRTPRAVIPMGVPDPKVFVRTPIPKLDSELRVLYVGRLDPEKGVKTIIDALAGPIGNLDVHLRVLGTGSEEQQLRTYAARVADATVSFEGSAPVDQVASAMSWSHIVVVPSLVTSRWAEQWGRVAVEAILSGRPCLVSRSGELPLISPNPETHFLPGSADDLRRKIELLSSNVSRLRETAQDQHDNIRRFDPETLGHALYTLWEEALTMR